MSSGTQARLSSPRAAPAQRMQQLIDESYRRVTRLLRTGQQQQQQQCTCLQLLVGEFLRAFGGLLLRVMKVRDEEINDILVVVF